MSLAVSQKGMMYRQSIPQVFHTALKAHLENGSVAQTINCLQSKLVGLKRYKLRSFQCLWHVFRGGHQVLPCIYDFLSDFSQAMKICKTDHQHPMVTQQLTGMTHYWHTGKDVCNEQ